MMDIMIVHNNVIDTCMTNCLLCHMLTALQGVGLQEVYLSFRRHVDMKYVLPLMGLLTDQGCDNPHAEYWVGEGSGYLCTAEAYLARLCSSETVHLA